MSVVMPWGRYRDTPISDVDSSYLCFVLERCSPAPDLQQAVRAELQSRFGAQLPPPRSRSGGRSCPDPDLAQSLPACMPLRADTTRTPPVATRPRCSG
jgi:hypothetical protein